jgi:DNA gyrase/topoisomerase IV subunit A
MAGLERKFALELDQAEFRLEIVMGFIKTIDKIDAIVKTIRSSASKREALIALVDRPFKFTRDQAEAILEMRLRQLTGLDEEELRVEEAKLKGQIEELDRLVKDTDIRSKWLFKQMNEIAKRHGQARRSVLIDTPDTLTPTKTERGTAAPRIPKPRFMKVDQKKGTIEQVKGPRGAMVVDANDKIILMTQDGTLKKVGANFKGPISNGYTPVALVKKETEVSERKFLTVFVLDGQLKAMMIDGKDLCRVTSKGKRWLPEGAEFQFFGEGSYTVPWVSPRKKKVELFPVTIKAGRPGSKGVKVASLSEVKL